MTAVSNELLVCRDVSLGYEGQSVLEHLDLNICAGDFYASWARTAAASPPC